MMSTDGPVVGEVSVLALRRLRLEDDLEAALEVEALAERLRWTGEPGTREQRDAGERARAAMQEERRGASGGRPSE